MKIWQNSVYAPNRGKKSHKASKKSHKRRGRSLARANASHKRRKPRKSSKRTGVKRNTGRTLASYNKKRKTTSHKRRSPNPGSIVLHNKGEMIALKPLLVAGVGGAGAAGLMIWLSEKYLAPKIPGNLSAANKSAAIGVGVALIGGFGVAKFKNKNAKLASAGAAVIGVAYALNSLFGAQVKSALGMGGMFAQPGATGSVSLTSTTSRGLGGMTVSPASLPAPGATQGTSPANLYAKHVF